MTSNTSRIENKSVRAFWLALTLLTTTTANAQTIDITSIQDKGGSVEITIETDIATPFEVMSGIGLFGQADDEVFVGNNVRKTVTSAKQTLIVPSTQRGEALPPGKYEAEVDFYPRWGAKSSPASTREIKTEIHANRFFTLTGAGASASDVAKREKLQKWVMLNMAAGDTFDMDTYSQRLGESVTMDVTNRNHLIKAHYFPAADMTLFENTLKGTLVTWRKGKTNRL